MVKNNFLKIITILILILSISGIAFSEEQGINQLIIGGVNVELPEISIYLDVQNNLGMQTVDLIKHKDHIKVYIDGKEININKITNDKEPILYVLAIDISKSLSKEEFEGVKTVLIQMVRNLDELDEVAIITFGKQVNLLLEKTSDKEEIINNINEIHLTDMSTKFYEGVDLAHKYANNYYSNNITKKAIIVISDGVDDYPGGITKEEVIENIKIDSIPIYSIGMYRGKLNNSKQLNLDILGRFSRESNGLYFQKENTNLSKIFGDIKIHLDRQVKIKVDLNEDADGSKKLIYIKFKTDDISLTASSYVKFVNEKDDTIKPEIKKISQVSINEIRIEFSEKILGYDNKANYKLDNNKNIIERIFYDNEKNILNITFKEELSIGNHNLIMPKITDVSKNENIIKSSEISFSCNVEEKVKPVKKEEKKIEKKNKKINLDKNVILIVFLVILVLIILLIIRKRKRKKVIEIKEKKKNKAKEKKIDTSINIEKNINSNTVLLEESYSTELLEIEIKLVLIINEIDIIESDLSEILIIGRMANCDITLDDSEVSRNHSSIEIIEDEIVIKDLNSTNGTFVNKEDVIDYRILIDGDIIQIGNSEIEVQISEE